MPTSNDVELVKLQEQLKEQKEQMYFEYLRGKYTVTTLIDAAIALGYHYGTRTTKL
jgi:hypothetical protein